MRGAMAAGKSTWLKENKLEQFVISADNVRLLFQSPVMLESGKMGINSRSDQKVWRLIMKLLEERMMRGELTIIDATHAKQEMISQYKELCQKYRYRCSIVDFSDVPLNTLLKQNSMRDEYKHVPEHVIENAHTRMETEHVPKWVDVIKPEEFNGKMQFYATDYSDKYKKIHHIGDIHGCYDALMDYFSDTKHAFEINNEGLMYYPLLHDDELYIFVGDIIDRGIQNAETLTFFLNVYNKKNVAIVEGNHEIHLMRWASGEESKSKEFVAHTVPQFEAAGMDNEETKKEIRQFYRKLRQLVYYTFNGKEVIVTHGGIAKMPDNLMYMATEQFIKGVGDYEIDIDKAWGDNLPYVGGFLAQGGRGNSKLVQISESKKAEIYQIHGHRNIFKLPIEAGKNSYNTEGQVEFGRHLRCVTLTVDGFTTYEIKNDVCKIHKDGTPKTIEEKELSVTQFIEYLSNHKEITEKHLGGNLYSYNFTRKAFTDKIWDDINVKARGLFINKHTEEISARSYNKFFSVNERSFTKMNKLADNLVFPVQVYDKPNGYLGILGYDSESDELIFSSKSETRGNHAAWFKELFYQTFGDVVFLVKHYLKTKNASLVFEVIKIVDDPHIIEYTEDKIVLLDIVKRQVVYEKAPYEQVVSFSDSFHVECKQLMHTFDNWTDFYVWYRDIVEDMSIETEGYVIEDSVGFMTKLKLPYYNFWKQMRGVKDKFAKKHEHTISGSRMYTSLHNEVFRWMKNQDANWLKDTGIIAVRNKFYKDKAVMDQFLREYDNVFLSNSI